MFMEPARTLRWRHAHALQVYQAVHHRGRRSSHITSMLGWRRPGGCTRRLGVRERSLVRDHVADVLRCEALDPPWEV